MNLWFIVSEPEESAKNKKDDKDESKAVSLEENKEGTKVAETDDQTSKEQDKQEVQKEEKKETHTEEKEETQQEEKEEPQKEEKKETEKEEAPVVPAVAMKPFILPPPSQVASASVEQSPATTQLSPSSSQSDLEENDREWDVFLCVFVFVCFCVRDFGYPRSYIIWVVIFIYIYTCSSYYIIVFMYYVAYAITHYNQ